MLTICNSDSKCLVWTWKVNTRNDVMIDNATLFNVLCCQSSLLNTPRLICYHINKTPVTINNNCCHCVTTLWLLTITSNKKCPDTGTLYHTTTSCQSKLSRCDVDAASLWNWAISSNVVKLTWVQKTCQSVKCLSRLSRALVVCQVPQSWCGMSKYSRSSGGSEPLVMVTLYRQSVCRQLMVRRSTSFISSWARNLLLSTRRFFTYSISVSV